MAAQLTLEGYLKYLLDRGYISSIDLQTITQALGSLLKRYQNLTTVRSVQDEYALTKNKNIRDLEESLWGKTNLIRDFNLAQVTPLFLVTRNKDPNRTVRGLTRERDQELAHISYVPPHLNEAEKFFWIILRMCRLQQVLDDAALADNQLKLTDMQETVSQAFLEGGTSVDHAVATAQAQPPPVEAETTTELVKAALDFVGATKGTEPPKSRAERILDGLINLVFRRNKWRRIAVDTRLPE